MHWDLRLCYRLLQSRKTSEEGTFSRVILEKDDHRNDHRNWCWVVCRRGDNEVVGYHLWDTSRSCWFPEAGSPGVLSSCPLQA